MTTLRLRLLAFALLVTLAGAAFALGTGVQALLGADAEALGARPGRAVATPTAEGVPPAAPSTVVTAVDDGRGSRFGLLDEVYAILERDFVEPDAVDLKTLRDAAIRGTIAALNDPHSAYIDAETFRLSSEDISGEFEGIGATVQQSDTQIIISSVFRGSPAETAGMRSGDEVVAVDGDSTEGWNLQQAVARIRGPRGTVVEVTVIHRTGDREVLPITRDRITVPSVQSLQIQDRSGAVVDDMAYILITQFTALTGDELVPLVESAKAAGLRQIILDLRGNPGGLLTATVETTSVFQDGGLVLTEVDREGGRQEFPASTGGAGVDLQIAILVDGGSASGSEVMAAALQETGRAIIIGEQTLGKGTVNIPRRLSDGSVLYVSVARWLTPNGSLLEGVGVIPDLVVTPSDTDFEQRRDVQLFAAIEWLRANRTTRLGGT